MKTEELKNLTPEMVEELRSLGVEFENTQDVWLCERGSDFYQRIPRRKKDCYPTQEMETEVTYHISAPNLQEVLDKLPKQFSDGKNCYCLVLDYATNVMYYYDAVKSMYPFNSKNSPSFSLDNPLIAAYELLKCVATNHHEAIKGGSDE